MGLGSSKKGQFGLTMCWYYRPEQVRSLPAEPTNVNIADYRSIRLSIPHEDNSGKEKYSKPVSAPTLPFSSPFIFDRLRRSLRRPPPRRHHRKNSLPIHGPPHPRAPPPTLLVPRLAPLRLRLPLQRPRTRLRPHQKLELVRPGGSTQIRRVHADLSV